MDNAHGSDMAYGVQAVSDSNEPLFTQEAADLAKQVVPLPNPVLEGTRRWEPGQLHTYKWLLTLAIVFGLAGGVTGGLIAAAQRAMKPELDLSLFDAGVDAITEVEPAPTRAVFVQPPESFRLNAETRDPEIYIDPDEDKDRFDEEPRKRESRSRGEAYLYGEITGGEKRPRRVRKPRYWDDESQ